MNRWELVNAMFNRLTVNVTGTLLSSGPNDGKTIAISGHVLGIETEDGSGYNLIVKMSDANGFIYTLFVRSPR